MAKDSFDFCKEGVVQDPEFYMRTLDVGSLFANITLKEIIDIFTNTLSKNIERVEGLSKVEFTGFLSLATKESYLTFNGKLYKRLDGVAMGSTLGPTWLMLFLHTLGRIGYKIRPYADDIFV